MFAGEAIVTVDDKGRLAIPVAFRDQVMGECGGRLMLTYNPYEVDCLSLYPLADWETLRGQLMAMKQASSGNRRARAKLIGGSALMELDAAGRILLPASHRITARIERKAVLVGMGNKLDLWNEQAHLAQAREVIREEDMTDELRELDF
ncbi:MAG TPA: transcriptional regulator MraZ [Xanthomonadales bacterium]|nr:transcriptional regulator MraZ [Xanthomonadales bacterium]